MIDIWTDAVDRARRVQELVRTANLDSVLTEVTAWLPAAERAVQVAADRVTATVPLESARIAQRRRPPPSGPISTPPAALLPGSSAEEAQALWRTQATTTSSALLAIACDDRSGYAEWFQDWTEGAEPVRPYYRAEMLRDYLHELDKLAQLLKAPRLTVQEPAQELARDPLTGPLTAWDVYGGELSQGTDGTTIAGSGNTLWWRPEVAAGGIISFLYHPLPTPDGGGGALFGFPAAPLTSDGYAMSQGPMERYNGGIDTYHCSLCRGKSGVTNLRRTARGLRMLSTMPDACAARGRDYRVEFAVRPGTVLVRVDGRLIHHYVEQGSHGPARLGGRFGVRLFIGAANRIRLADLRLHAW